MATIAFVAAVSSLSIDVNQMPLPKLPAECHTDAPLICIRTAAIPCGSDTLTE